MKLGAALGLLVLLGAACGGDDDDDDDDVVTIDASADTPDASAPAIDAPPPIDADPTACGTGTVTGTITGQTVSPVVGAWYDEVIADGFAIVLDELDSSCANPTPAGTGERLALLFCAPVVADTYTIVNEAAFPKGACPGQLVAFSIVEDQTGADLDEAVSGSVVVTSATASCIRGTFNVTYDLGDTLQGTFAVHVCP